MSGATWKEELVFASCFSERFSKSHSAFENLERASQRSYEFVIQQPHSEDLRKTPVTNYMVKGTLQQILCITEHLLQLSQESATIL